MIFPAYIIRLCYYAILYSLYDDAVLHIVLLLLLCYSVFIV